MKQEQPNTVSVILLRNLADSIFGDFEFLRQVGLNANSFLHVNRHVNSCEFGERLTCFWISLDPGKVIGVVAGACVCLSGRCCPDTLVEYGWGERWVPGCGWDGRVMGGGGTIPSQIKGE